MKKFKTSVPFIILAVILIAGSIALVLHYVSSNSAFGKAIVQNIAISRCNSAQDKSRKCFNLEGIAYIVNTNDTEKISNKLAGIVKSQQLTDNKDFKLVDGKTIAKNAQQPDSMSASDQRNVGNLIALAFSNGLFGEYVFPYSNTGHALYVSSFIDDTKSSDNDSIYVLKSEFGATEAQAQTILKKAKALPKTQYILFVAQ